MTKHSDSRDQVSTLLDLAPRFRSIRSFTTELATPLAAEDQVVQSMPDVSPTKWHLAHTTWFFERFVIRRFAPERGVYHPRFHDLFNSYYETVGVPFSRPRRGLLSRPTVAEIKSYRDHVDDQVRHLLGTAAEEDQQELASRVELGLQHEQQHQELLLTDIKHVFSCNPLNPVYNDPSDSGGEAATGLGWIGFEGGENEIGQDEGEFSFDNERPRHAVLLGDFELATRVVTCGEYREFIEAGGYSRPELWMSDGWAQIQEEGWGAPLYWRRQDGDWHIFTLGGLQPLEPHEPVTHVSFYEADAFARWSDARLPSEAEWEIACRDLPIRGNFADSYRYHPRSLRSGNSEELQQAYGDVWEWTQSPYGPYPGYQPLPGSLGEYNGKFMCNQMVLRGGSCVTSRDHIRPTYRNFFYPFQRWQFSGIRLAKDV